MMTRRAWLMVAVLLVVVSMAPMAAADITGKMKLYLGESDVLDGKVDGDRVTFGELLKFEGMEIKITYTGTVVSADEIKHPQRCRFRAEELVAKRVK